MCGRFARYAPLTEWVEALGTGVDPALLDGLAARDAGPRYNIAPGTPSWIAAFDAEGEHTCLDPEHRTPVPTLETKTLRTRRS